MANNSIFAAFERMWRHTSNTFATKTSVADQIDTILDENILYYSEGIEEAEAQGK